ncbi:unnamed protein product [Blepharisma stoltei]|uniref:Uncharacterized protein n=1 Tax=Blepharisma stoltei TaxID=1481888 RepID=A0AAU9IE51_9CILI|nr:unnamed protein product [Blepharisma stoltei]
MMILLMNMKKFSSKWTSEFRGDATCERLLNALETISKPSQIPTYTLSVEQFSSPSRSKVLLHNDPPKPIQKISINIEPPKPIQKSKPGSFSFSTFDNIGAKKPKSPPKSQVGSIDMKKLTLRTNFEDSESFRQILSARTIKSYGELSETRTLSINRQRPITANSASSSGRKPKLNYLRESIRKAFQHQSPELLQVQLEIEGKQEIQRKQIIAKSSLSRRLLENKLQRPKTVERPKRLSSSMEKRLVLIKRPGIESLSSSGLSTLRKKDLESTSDLKIEVPIISFTNKRPFASKRIPVKVVKQQSIACTTESEDCSAFLGDLLDSRY